MEINAEQGPGMEQTDDIAALWDQIGVPELGIYDQVVEAGGSYLREKGYDSEEAWVESYQHHMLRIAVVQSQYRFLMLDLADLSERVKECDPKVEVRVVRRRQKAPEA